MKKIKLVTIILVCLCNFSFSQTITCNDLIQYRDNTLISIYDKEAKRYELLSTYKQDILAEISKLEALGNSADWGIVALGLKTIGDKVSGTLNLLKTIQVLPKSAANAMLVYEAIQKNKNLLDKMTSENMAQAIWKEIENEVIGALPILGGVHETIKNIKQFNDYLQAKQSIIDELKKAGVEIAKIDDKLKKSNIKIKAINSYKNYIDDYLTKNCE